MNGFFLVHKKVVSVHESPLLQGEGVFVWGLVLV